MRILILLMTACLMQVSASTFAQKISLSEKNANLSKVFDKISDLTGLDFLVSTNALSDSKKVTINVKGMELKEVLRILFADQSLEYSIEDKFVVVSKKDTPIPDKVSPNFSDIDISGMVVDEKGIGLNGATVKVKNTKKVAVTNDKGVFELRNIDSKAILEISFIGYQTKEVAAATSLKITLNAIDNKMDDVVVTGIFNKKKESYTGAAKVITDVELKQFQGRNLFTTLGNIDPSFYVIPNNTSGSDPNKIPDIQIRGARNLPNIDQLQDQTSGALNIPLIILDGFETTLQRMMDLDNNEIQSVTLLKDGSATALYGSRGANGVVVIKTKEPEPGSLKLSYRVGLNLSVPDLSSYNLLNSADKLELERLSHFYESPTKSPDANIGLEQYYNQVLSQVKKGVNTDWLSIPLRTQVDQNHNLKIEGGDQTFRYDLGLQYNQQNGVMKESGRRTFNGTINLSYRYKELTFRNNLVVGQTKATQSPYGSFADYAKLNPYWAPYDAAGNVVKFFSPYNYDYSSFGNNVGKPYANPLYDATLNTFDIQTYTSITDNFQLEWTPIKGLYLRSGVGVAGNLSNVDDFKPAEHSSFASYSDADIFRKGSYDYSSGKDFSYTGNFSASYSNLFAGIHRIYAGINLDVSESNTKNYTFNLEGYPDESIDLLSMALQYKQNGAPSGLESTKRRVGALANVNYALKDRYLIDLSYRLDGASQFGVNRRFAPFWSAGLGWNMHYESFIKDNLKFIDYLKLRGSYGSTGTTQFDAYQALGTFSYITNDRYKTWLGARQNSLGNPDLEWQQTNKYNVGLEMTLFKNRVNVVGDVYLERTSNLLSSLDLPYANGFTTYNENIGAVESKGYELTASVWVIRNNTKRFSWSLTGSMVYNKDKIVELSEAMKEVNRKLENPTGPAMYSLNKIIKEGASQYTIYAVRSLGIDPSTGKELFLNKNGQVSYTWNSNDRVDVGIDQPKYRGNFSTLFRYGNFTFNASFGFRFGGQIYNQTLIDKVENADRQFNVDERVYFDRWKQPGDVAYFRGINETSKVFPSSRFVQNENTITCQNVLLSYEVTDKKILNRFGMRSLSLAANTGELFYISSVRQERGTGYPFTRQFSMSLYTSF
ncbi:SusC/RagA family TonB-linked outer membrane protein [Pedobacter miscanthi]|nr:SusC/RagA family TonB-linked outer membrane protein [Pedobacter miscanthi]